MAQTAMQPSSPPSSFTTDRPVAVLMVFLAAVVFGYFSYQRLPVTLMPELSYPTLTVRTEYPGAAPEEVENDVSRPVEEALGVVSGLSQISSISRAGISDVVLEFLWGTDMSKATQDTLEKLDLVFLPREAERPLILHFDPALDPIMELSFSGKGARFEGEPGMRRLRRIAELQIKRGLEPIKGVAAVRVRGGLEEEIHVLLDERALERAGISIQTVIDRLRQENINVAGGTIKEGKSEYMVRTLNEYENLEQIAETVIIRSDRQDVRVKDLGRVIRSHKEREIITRTDGAESVQIDIYKEADANMVAVAAAVAERLGKVEPDDGAEKQGGPAFGPQRRKNEGLATQLHREEGAALQIVADRSKFIESSINEVRDTAISGGILAVAILYLFLRDARTTAIIGISIPMSLLITFAPLNLFGVSLNIMSLGGLALGVGMLVDNSIVVLESIFRCREEGDNLRVAAIRGTREVAAAVTSSTLTTVAVFFPMVFVEGIAGQAFGDLGLAVVTSLLASLVVAIWFVPMLASRGQAIPGLKDVLPAGNAQWLDFASWRLFQEQRPQMPKRWAALLWPYILIRLTLSLVLETAGKLLLLLITGILFAVAKITGPVFRSAGNRLLRAPLDAVETFWNRLNGLYPRCVGWTLRHPGAVFGIVVLTGAITWQAGRQLESELLPEVHQGEFTFEVALPIGTPLEETAAVLSKVEAAVMQNKEDIQSVLVTFGYDVTNLKRSDEGEHSARFKILLAPNKDQAGVEARVLQRLRQHFESVPDLEVRVARPILFSSRAPIVVEIQGDDLDDLKKAANQAELVLSSQPELADVESTLRRGAPEIQITYDRDRIVRYGMNIGQAARLVRDMVKGFEATRFNMKDRRVPILVRLEEEGRDHAETIGRLTMNAGGEQHIPLSSIAQLKLGEGPSEIRRVDGQRVALVQSGLGIGSLGGAVKVIENKLRDEIAWPPGMHFAITGQNEEWERSKGSLYLALGLSLFLVYVIMAAQFESLLQPMIIMLTVPLALFGSVLGLNLLGLNVSIVVFLGMITLAGIVVNNAIVLVDYTNVLRARGMGIREALVAAGSVRLRPIMLTTATTVLGLLPMALGLGDGAEIRTPMAITVICGLASSTLLTLLVIPTIYLVVETAKAKLIPASAPGGALAPAVSPEAAPSK